jgi:HK97 family phage portal protein
MGFIARLFGRTETETRAAGDYLPAGAGLFGAGGFNDSGVAVTEANALNCSAVWACAQIIAEAVANLPAHVHQRTDAAKLYDHPVAMLLHTEPNEYMTPFVFRSAVMLNALLWGAGYAVIDRNELGVASGLYPILSCHTRPIRTPAGTLVYQTMVAGKTHYLTPDQVLFIPGLTLDGITGLNPIMHAKQAIGTAMAMERYAAKVFGSNGNTGGILKTPTGMKEEAMKAFVASWRAHYAGIDNALKVAVLPEGWDYKQTALDPEKGQMTQAQQNQVLAIARYYRVPPHMLGIMDKASYASIEQTNLEFYQNCVQGWVTKVEQEATRKLFLERERPTHEVKLNMDQQLRSSTTERYAAHATAINAGFLTVNEARAKENLQPVKGGDTLRVPLNMGPADQKPAPANPAPDKTAARSLIEDAARRLLVKEGKALTRAAKKFAGKPAELRQWAETWYAGHRALVARILAPAIRAAGLDTEPDEYAAEHCAESVRQITAAIEAAVTAEDISDEWEAIRPAQIVDSLFDEDGGKRNAAA